jgi:hypothetical protein
MAGLTTTVRKRPVLLMWPVAITMCLEIWLDHRWPVLRRSIRHFHFDAASSRAFDLAKLEFMRSAQLKSR